MDRIFFYVPARPWAPMGMGKKSVPMPDSATDGEDDSAEKSIHASTCQEESNVIYIAGKAGA